MMTAGLLVPALFAGLVAIGATVAIERWGGRLGGLLGTLPTTIVPGAWGIYASAEPEAFAAAMGVVPGGMLLNALFLLLWRELPGRLQIPSLRGRLTALTAISLGAWAVAGAVLVLAQSTLQGAGVPPRISGMALGGVLVALGLFATRRSHPAPRGSRPVGPGTLLARGVLAAAAIAAAISIAQTGAGLLSGLASVFPAIFLTTMVSLWLAQGQAVPAGAVGPMMLGSSGVAAYALLAAWSLPALGPALGTLVAWIGAVVLVDVPAWRWLHRHD